MASSVVRAVKRPFITIGTSKADYITSGTADQSIFNVALTENPSGIHFVKSGTYVFSGKVDINSPSNANLTYRGAGKNSTIIQASTSFSDGLFTATGQVGGLENIAFEDMTLDCNSKANVIGVKLRGGEYTDGDSLRKITFRRCIFKNLATVDLGHVTIYSGRGSTDRGPVTDIVMEDCEFLDTVKYHWYAIGGEVENILWSGCTFKNSQYGSIGFNQPNKDDSSIAAGVRSNKNWEIDSCYVINNHLNSVSLGGFTAFLTDSNKTGIRGLNVHDNWFEGYTQTTTEQYIFSLNSCWDVKIHSNTFWKVRSCFNIGQSNNGPWFQNDGSQMVSIKDNTFFRCYNLVDHDADFFSEFSGNKIIECEYAGWGGYSRQWPSKFHDNQFYNTPTDESVANQNKAAFSCTANGNEIYNNTVIDDRLLADPTTAPVLTSVAGGSLGSRTYYVKYTWANDTGETIGSTESSLAVSANQLLKVTHPYTSTYGPPSGAKLVKIYVSTSSGSYTTGLQASVPTAWQQEYEIVRTNTFGAVDWTEPATGLVSGSAIPGSNTTNAITLYGIYEVSGGSGPKYPNKYYGNKLYGIATPINKVSGYKRVAYNNYTNFAITSDDEKLVEAIPYAQGNVTGATTFDVNNGEYITFTLTGAVTTTLSGGHYVGQELILEGTQDGTGSRTLSKPTNARLPGGVFAPTATAAATDRWVLRWNGTSWVERSRTLNIS